jgi:hypothetical protein
MVKVRMRERGRKAYQKFRARAIAKFRGGNNDWEK